MTLPPASLAIGGLACATHAFWRACRGARDALTDHNTLLASLEIETLAAGGPTWPPPIRERAAERAQAFFAELCISLPTRASP